RSAEQGKQLLAELERKITERALSRILSVVKSFSIPPLLLIYTLKSYELSALKECLCAASDSKKEIPSFCDTGSFSSIRYSAYPDIAAMLKNTEYKSYINKNAVESGADIAALEVKLDYYFYERLFKSLSDLSGDDYETARKLLCDEISLRNCIWALRLRGYYEKNEAQTSACFMNFAAARGSQKKENLAFAAKASLKFHLDVRQHWTGWKWEKFLNADEPPAHWNADPEYFQNAASRYLYLHSFKIFHSFPVSVSSIYCFIKLIMFEEDLLLSAAQGLALGMESSAVLKMLGVD
ncbi:MAG: V-type ATPase subunit, partial [Treponema sp.]|nr:V-type ATPase subunit [Treponema sp.]